MVQIGSQDWLQTTTVKSLNTDLGRDAHEASVNCCAAAQHTAESMLVLETPSLTQSLALNRLSIRDWWMSKRHGCVMDSLKLGVCGTDRKQNKNPVWARMIVRTINFSSSVLKLNLQVCSVPDADWVHKTRKHELQIHPCALPKCQEGKWTNKRGFKSSFGLKSPGF